VDSKLPTQQRSLRSVGLNILESSMQSGPVATLPLSGTLIQPPHGIVNPEKRTQGTGHRQVKENFINLAVQKCGPAVVRIQTEQKVEVPALNSDIFSFFFGIRPPDQSERRIKGQGSGFCIDSSGVILTNAHVVQGADRITAHFAGKHAALECELLETDEVIDLAALRVKEKSQLPLPGMSLGYSEAVKTGDWTIVLGNPLGLQNTCTLGIVSSLDRSTGETGFDWMRHPLIQTDAAVNQGNSGGPMLNELGEVIGMISMRALFGEGIGFAIPVDSIRSALPNLISKKKVPRPYIGLKMKSVESESSGGAYVEMVLEGSPAAEAKIKESDQILEVNGQKLRHFEQVQIAIRSTKVGGQVKLKIRRGKESISTTVTTADIRKLREAKGQESPKRRVVIIP